MPGPSWAAARAGRGRRGGTRAPVHASAGVGLQRRLGDVLASRLDRVSAREQKVVVPDRRAGDATRGGGHPPLQVRTGCRRAAGRCGATAGFGPSSCAAPQSDKWHRQGQPTAAPTAAVHISDRARQTPLEVLVGQVDVRAQPQVGAGRRPHLHRCPPREAHAGQDVVLLQQPFPRVRRPDRLSGRSRWWLRPGRRDAPPPSPSSEAIAERAPADLGQPGDTARAEVEELTHGDPQADPSRDVRLPGLQVVHGRPGRVLGRAEHA